MVRLPVIIRTSLFIIGLIFWVPVVMICEALRFIKNFKHNLGPDMSKKYKFSWPCTFGMEDERQSEDMMRLDLKIDANLVAKCIGEPKPIMMTEVSSPDDAPDFIKSILNKIKDASRGHMEFIPKPEGLEHMSVMSKYTIMFHLAKMFQNETDVKAIQQNIIDLASLDVEDVPDGA